MSLFNIQEEDDSMSFLKDDKKGQDGIYRIDYKKAADPKKGYVSTIRLLPWVKEIVDGQPVTGPNAIKRIMTYVKIDNADELNGYYDSPSNFQEKCELSSLYFTLDKSPNPMLKDRAKCLNKVTKYYSYAIVLEDKQQPELEGQIVVFPYGWKIAQKIDAEWNGENAEGTKCKVYDLAQGKDLKMVVKDVGGYQNYDSCYFMEKSPIKIKGKAMPTEEITTKTKSGETITGKVIKKDLQEKLLNFLLDRKTNIADFEAKRLTEEQQANISQIVKLLTGKPTGGSDLFNNNETTTAEELFGDSKTDKSKNVAKQETVKTPVQQEDPFADLDTTTVAEDEDPFADLD